MNTISVSSPAATTGAIPGDGDGKTICDGERAWVSATPWDGIVIGEDTGICGGAAIGEGGAPAEAGCWDICDVDGPNEPACANAALALAPR